MVRWNLDVQSCRLEPVFRVRYHPILWCIIGGIGFLVSEAVHPIRFYSTVPPNSPVNGVMFYEALYVVSALNQSLSLVREAQHITIFTDSSNTVDIFNSLRATPPYNQILLCANDILINREVQLRVLHIPGELNTVADALSRRYYMWVKSFVPDLKINDFSPPQQVLGVSKKWLHCRQGPGSPWESWTLDRLVSEQSTALGWAIDSSSQITYTPATNSWITFCHLHQFPIEPNPDSLVVYMSRHINPHSVDSYLSGICNQLEPHFPDVRTIRKSPLVACTYPQRMQMAL